MCKIGDIIVIDNYIGDDGKFINRHSFVIISNKKGKIQGISYDLAANVISSIKNEKQKYKKLKYKENLELKNEDVISKFKSEKDSYIKVDKIFYFQKERINYYILGKINDDLLEKLLNLILELSKNNKLTNVAHNIMEE